MSLYRDDILDHYHHPQNFGKPERFTHASEQLNQACGDRQSVYMTIDKGEIKDARFEGAGCAISVASTSLLTEHIKGKRVEELRDMKEADMTSLLGSSITAGRMGCAMLGLKSFQKAIENEQGHLSFRPSPEASGEISHESVRERDEISRLRKASARDDEASSYVAKDSNLGEIAGKYPQAARIFTEYGLHCVGCFASAFDTVEAGASIHGMSTEEIEDMIKQANDEIERNPNETIRLVGSKEQSDVSPTPLS